MEIFDPEDIYYFRHIGYATSITLTHTEIFADTYLKNFALWHKET